jgi:hypothetical protein
VVRSADRVFSNCHCQFDSISAAAVAAVVLYGGHFGRSAVVQARTCDSGKERIVWEHYFI